MRLVATIGGLFLAAVILTVGSPPVNAQASTEQEPTPKKIYVTVKKGDSLSKIAQRKGTTYKRLYFANKQVKNPDLIYPDQKLRVPHKDEKLKARPLTNTQQSIAKVSEQAHASTQRPLQKQQHVNAPSVASGSVWDRLAACESGGNWSINTGNGYYGGLQFSAATWRAVGGSGLPHQHSRAEQIKRGQILQARSGWGQWPACTAKLGLR